MSQLVIENYNATGWFVASEAHVFQENGHWYIKAFRNDEEIVWSTMQHKPYPSMQVLSDPSITVCSLSRPKSDELNFNLDLSDIHSATKNTFNTTVGELVSYSIQKNNKETLEVFSWMNDFVSAWRSGELYYKQKPSK